ncbi:MAG: hypothetical protein LBP76_10950 [Treponema sp.]|jgi:hypothetical protein|nr:hypothetical protein [Treponema sp.]
MAINRLEEPDMNAFYSDLNQPILLADKTTFISRGHSNIKIDDANKMLAGSTFEMNGAYFSLDDDTDILNFDPAAGNYSSLYVYVVEELADAYSLSFSVTAPIYNPVKGGWYTGNNRALAYGYKFEDHFVVTEYIQGLRRLDRLISIAERGYINVVYSNNTILAGSTYEANSGMHGNAISVGVSGWSNNWSDGSRVYIYAVDEEPNSSYYFSQASPYRDLARGAFYNGNDRAVAFGTKFGNTFSLISYLSPWVMLSTIDSIIYEGTSDQSLILNPGRYLVILRGGRGGNGGRGGSSDHESGGSGGYGYQGETISQEIYIVQSMQATLLVGIDGRDGTRGTNNSGNYGPAGGGGAGGANAVFSIPGISTNIVAMGGGGGGGGGGTNSIGGDGGNGGYGGGGGGGGGSGINSQGETGNGGGAGGSYTGGIGGGFNSGWTNKRGGDGGNPGEDGKDGSSEGGSPYGIGGSGVNDDLRKAGGGGGGANFGYSDPPGDGGSVSGSRTTCGIYRLV